MAIITFTIDDSKLDNIKEAFVSLYNKDESFTDNQWVKECIKQYVIKTVARYNHLKKTTQCIYEEDNNLIL